MSGTWRSPPPPVLDSRNCSVSSAGRASFAVIYVGSNAHLNAFSEGFSANHEQCVFIDDSVADNAFELQRNCFFFVVSQLQISLQKSFSARGSRRAASPSLRVFHPIPPSRAIAAVVIFFTRRLFFFQGYDCAAAPPCSRNSVTPQLSPKSKRREPQGVSGALRFTVSTGVHCI